MPGRFRARRRLLTLAAVVNAEPTPPSQLAKELPHELERIILRCLRKDPARRFQVMADLAVDLEELRTESVRSDRRGGRAPAPKRRSRLGGGLGDGNSAGSRGCLGAVAEIECAARHRPPWRRSPRCLATNGLSTFSPDGNQVAFAWNGENGDEHRHLRAARRIGNAVARSPRIRPRTPRRRGRPTAARSPSCGDRDCERPSISPRHLCRTPNRSSRTSARSPSSTTTSPRSRGSPMASC